MPYHLLYDFTCNYWIYESYFTFIHWISVAANKGEAEPERKETRVKVDEDRKHEYPFEINLYCKLFLFWMRKGIGLQIIFSY